MNNCFPISKAEGDGLITKHALPVKKSKKGKKNVQGNKLPFLIVQACVGFFVM